MDGGWFRLEKAKLYTRASSPPKLYVSAFGPQAARIAGRHGDGLWTLGNPDQAPEVIEAYRASCEEHDRPVGEIILQTGVAWAETEEAVIAGARRWKPTQLSSAYLDDLHDPEEMQRVAEQEYTDDEFAHEGFIVSADVEHHLESPARVVRARAHRDLHAADRPGRPARNDPHLRPRDPPQLRDAAATQAGW